MNALDGFLMYLEILDEEEVRAYQWSMLVWASKTCMADPKEAEKVMPKLPEAKDDSGTEYVSLSELINKKKI